jgi:AcrR family transcriptional regulator
MPPKSSKTREKILSTASELFYRKGIRNVGIDEVIASSGVAKMTLYKHFPSKDQLILETVRYGDEKWCGWFFGAVEERGTTAKERLIAMFDVLQEWFESPEFRGCPFINAVAELADTEHPAHRAALGPRHAIRTYVQKLAEEAGSPNSEDFSQQFVILFGGAIVMASMEGGPAAAQYARQAASVLLSAE